MELASKTVLLTGATGGIGHAIARRLRAAGADLVLTGRRTDLLADLAAETGARSLAIDLADREQVVALAGECADVDVLVANAALPASGELTTYTVEQLDRALDVNLRAPMMLTHALLERMIARGSGHFLYVSSVAGKTSAPGSSVYSATKFGLRGFAQGLRYDLHPKGIGVSVVFPGFISDAGMFADAGVKMPWYVGTSTPEQVADAVVGAIERNRGEVDVAPLGMRIGTAFAGVAPELTARVQRRLGAERLGAEFGAAQLDKR